MSPRWKAGSMDPESTTTTGLSLYVINMRNFHIMSADSTTMPRFRAWNSSCRLCDQR
jgi:hypothetical protein